MRAEQGPTLALSLWGGYSPQWEAQGAALPGTVLISR